MQWREIGSKVKFKDEGPPADAYIDNALFKKLNKHPSECKVIPEGALVFVGMSLLWRDSWLYPAFQRFDNGECSLFDFIDPPRHADLRSANRMVGEQEAVVLKIYIEHFLLPAIPAGSSAQVANLPPSSGSGVFLEGTKKMSRIRITGKKIVTTEATASPVAASVPAAPEGVVVTSAPAIVSPSPAPKWRRVVPSLSTFQATKTAQLLHADTLAGVQIEWRSSTPLTSGETSTFAPGSQSISLAVSCILGTFL
ncbi:hypothetical protein Hdeb2414_s0014g00431021 [Helianthus debilis subsp. tardiflorus]